MRATNGKTMEWKKRPSMKDGGAYGIDFTQDDRLGWTRIAYDSRYRQLVISGSGTNVR